MRYCAVQIECIFSTTKTGKPVMCSPVTSPFLSVSPAAFGVAHLIQHDPPKMPPFPSSLRQMYPVFYILCSSIAAHCNQPVCCWQTCECVHLCVDCSMTVIDGIWPVTPPSVPLSCWLSPMLYSWDLGGRKEKKIPKGLRIYRGNSPGCKPICRVVLSKKSVEVYLEVRWKKEENPTPTPPKHPQSASTHALPHTLIFLLVVLIRATACDNFNQL